MRGKGFTVVEEARVSASHRWSQDDLHWTNHGGVAVAAKHGLRVTKIKISLAGSSFEYMC
jgi:hypothetical protein